MPNSTTLRSFSDLRDTRFSRQLHNPTYANKGTIPVEKSPAPLPKVEIQERTPESSELPTLKVGSPIVEQGSDAGTQLGRSVWLPKFTLDLYLRATKSESFALKYWERRQTLISIYREVREALKDSTEQIKALREHGAVCQEGRLPTSLRALIYGTQEERRKSEAKAKAEALKTLGLDPVLFQLLSNIDPEKLKLLAK